jgi:hypothetical protein
MRANEKAGEGTEQLFDAPIDRIDRFARKQSPPDSALIADNGEGQSGGAKPIEKRPRIGRRLDALGVAVKGHVDNDRFVAVEENGAGSRH